MRYFSVQILNSGWLRSRNLGVIFLISISRNECKSVVSAALVIRRISNARNKGSLHLLPIDLFDLVVSFFTLVCPITLVAILQVKTSTAPVLGNFGQKRAVVLPPAVLCIQHPSLTHVYARAVL